MEKRCSAQRMSVPGLVFYPVICARDAFAGITVGLDSVLRLPRRPHADRRLCQFGEAAMRHSRRVATENERTRHKRTPSVRPIIWTITVARSLIFDFCFRLA